MTVDFHFQTASIVKYRTDVTFGWLDLMVSFGGIAGLFQGCSILSGAEIIFYIALALLAFCRKLKKKFDRVLMENSRQLRVNGGQKKLGKKFNGVRVIKVKSLSDIDHNNLKSSLQKNNKY